uniref:ARAD1D38324p n=1 Tax=Blastobotrys adeninivorans TaxID=409370 RepID=A0A060TCC0_BLAAD
MRPQPFGKKNKSAPAPKTPTEFLEAGISEEDGGDRWISSGDVPKGVRFYQRAYRLYKRAIELVNDNQQQLHQDNGLEIRNDAIYNICRMQFVVYMQVVKTDLLDEIASKLEPEPGHDSVIVKDIAAIASAHEQAVNMAGGPHVCPIDLVYNYAQVLVEAGERAHEDGNGLEAVQLFASAGDVFKVVVERQVTQLLELEQQSAGDLKQGADDGDNKNNNNDDSDNAGDDPEPQDSRGMNFGPAALIDTLVTNSHCLVSYLSVTPEKEQVSSVLQAHIGKLGEALDKYLERGEIHSGQADEARIAAASALSAITMARSQAQQQSPSAQVESINKMWALEELPNSPARYMAQADAFIELADSFENGADGQAWKALTNASGALQQGLNTNPVTVDAVNTCRLWNAKGDVEWMRRKLAPVDPSAQRNELTLLSNSKVYYTNAVNVQSLNVTQELRELKEEATVKLKILNGETPEGRIARRVVAHLQDEGLI